MIPAEVLWTVGLTVGAVALLALMATVVIVWSDWMLRRQERAAFGRMLLLPTSITPDSVRADARLRLSDRHALLAHLDVT